MLIKMGKEKLANWFQDEVGMCLIVGGHRKKDHLDPELCIELMAIAPSILCMSGMTGHGKRRRIQLKGQIVSQWTLHPTAIFQSCLTAPTLPWGTPFAEGARAAGSV